MLSHILQGCYISQLAIKQNNLFNSRRLISDVLEDPSIDGRIKNKLKLLKKILVYARSQGLNVKGAYQYYIAMADKEAVSYTVSAAYPHRLQSVKWWFPIVGSVPYKGFFTKNERDEEASRLQEEGFDVHSGSVGAFSSLGWFDDPIYSSMLRRSRESFANLIFHELTHRTVWFDDHAKFNENLATFIADLLTIKFLQVNKYHLSINTYDQKKRDRELFAGWLKRLKEELILLYSQKEYQKNMELLLSKKQQIFLKFVKDEKPNFERYDYVGKKPWNNARVLATSMYSPDFKQFDRAWKCSNCSTVGEFLNLLEQRVDSFSDPFRALKSICK